MAIGNFPFYNRPAPGGASARTLKATAAPYSLVVSNASANPDEVVPSTAAGQTGLIGVITDPQGDPNNSNNFVSGNVVNVTEHGKVPVLIVSGAVLTARCTLIASGTSGQAKVLGGEAKPYDVVGYYDDVPQTLTAATPLSVELNVHRVEA